jgi:hypothetical protein
MPTILESIIRARAKIGPVFDEIDGVRVEHKPYPTPEQLGVLLNEVAWEHRNEGWGLSEKPNGYSVPHPDGTRIASDILYHKPTNLLYDVLTAAGERSEPAFNLVGPSTDSSRPWKAPTNPGSEPIEPNDPETGSPIDAIASMIAELQGQVAEVSRELDNFGAPIELSLPKWLGGTIRGWVGKK